MTDLTILLIEDDALLRKSLYDTMKKWGHDVQSAECLLDAQKLMEQNEFDLVLLDMCLPDGNGIDFLSKKSEQDNKIPIVIMTAFADVDSAIKAIKAGAYDYLPKPFDNEQLKKILRNLTSNIELSRKITSLSQMTIGNYDNVWRFDEMIGTQSLKDIFETAGRVAERSDSTVLIMGESGTGKGMLAKAVHRMSKRVDKPFVDINCSAIPGQLIESEIFGYEKGAFTDAKNRKPGLLEIADGGTVFLDEIGDMEINLQSKILKVIEDKEFRRLGSGRMTSVDVRVIAATSRDLPVMIKDGRFREDLYYRLSVIPLVMPPLREHTNSIAPLADYYLKGFSKELGRDIRGFTKEAYEHLQNHQWPGNIRELKNAIERSVILANNDLVDVKALGLMGPGSIYDKSPADGQEEDVESADSFKPMSLADCEKKLISSVLNSVDGNKNKAAEILEIHRTTLYKKIDEYGLK